MAGNFLTTEDGVTALAVETSEPTQRRSFVSDKLAIINECLIATGNEPVTVAADGSDEWKTADSAYERHVPLLLARRTWKFSTRISAMVRLGDSNLPGFADVFDKPPDCLFLSELWRTDLAAMIPITDLYSVSARRPPALGYRIVTDAVHTIAPQGATCLYVPFPVGAQPWSIGFIETLRLRIEAALYRSRGDTDEAARRDREAEGMLAEAVNRVDSEERPRPAFRSSLLESRRIRRGGYGRGW